MRDSAPGLPNEAARDALGRRGWLLFAAGVALPGRAAIPTEVVDWSGIPRDLRGLIAGSGLPARSIGLQVQRVDGK
ncbi:MAG: hypothetical protein HY021_12225, partial [Burkholderiales bacterium]|nr:hypothetical protein [Burkholderiales bacterium]